MKRFICLLSFILLVVTPAFAESEKPPLHSPTDAKIVKDSVRVILHDVPESDLKELFRYRIYLLDLLKQVDDPEARLEQLKNLTLPHPRSLFSTILLESISHHYMQQMRLEEANMVVESVLDSMANYKTAGSMVQPFLTLKGCLLIRFGKYEEAREVFTHRRSTMSTAAYFTNEEYHQWFIPYCKQLRQEFPYLGWNPQPTTDPYIRFSISGESYQFFVDLIDGYYLGKEGNSYEKMQRAREERIGRGE